MEAKHQFGFRVALLSTPAKALDIWMVRRTGVVAHGPTLARSGSRKHCRSATVDNNALSRPYRLTRVSWPIRPPEPTCRKRPGVEGLTGQLSLRITEDAAKAMGITISPLAASNPDELRALEPTRLSGADGFLVLPDTMFWNHRETIVALANVNQHAHSQAACQPQTGVGASHPSPANSV
jgi:hypothetical protein